MSITSMGMFPGSIPKTNTSRKTPTMPYMPRPMEPTRAPIKIIARTTASSRKRNAASIILVISVYNHVNYKDTLFYEITREQDETKKIINIACDIKINAYICIVNDIEKIGLQNWLVKQL